MATKEDAEIQAERQYVWNKFMAEKNYLIFDSENKIINGYFFLLILLLL